MFDNHPLSGFRKKMQTKAFPTLTWFPTNLCSSDFIHTKTRDSHTHYHTIQHLPSPTNAFISLAIFIYFYFSQCLWKTSQQQSTICWNLKYIKHLFHMKCPSSSKCTFHPLPAWQDVLSFSGSNKNHAQKSYTYV